MQSILDLDRRIAEARQAVTNLLGQRQELLRATPLPAGVALVHRQLTGTVDVVVDGVRRAVVRDYSKPAGTNYHPSGVRHPNGSGYFTPDLREAVWVALIDAGYGMTTGPTKCATDGCSNPALDDVDRCMDCLDRLCGSGVPAPVRHLELVQGGRS